MKKILPVIFMIMCLHAVAKTEDNSFSLDTLRNSINITSLNISTDKNLSIGFPTKDAINGLSIDGRFTITGNKYFLRIILKDIHGKEYLVMESYNEINNERYVSFSNYCEETTYINNVQPDSIKIIAFGVEVQLDKVRYISNKDYLLKGETFSPDYAKSIKKRQVENIIKKINTYNYNHDKLWRADVTPLSLMSFEDKKRILGIDDNSCTGGVEYYAEGIFEIGDINDCERNEPSRTSFVDSFDWRNRHGKNWITPNKHQGNSGFCSAFTAVGVVEALTRLYYNQLIDIDLSEQEAACCNGDTIPWNGMPLVNPLKYIRDHGVCDEIAYPFVNDSLESLNCRSSDITPNELIRIGGYQHIIANEDTLKKALINHGPLASAIHYWYENSQHNNDTIHHAMPIVGFGQLHEGDTIYHWINPDGSGDGRYLVRPGDPRIGMTYWIYKNSYGTNNDTALNGYMHYIHYNYSHSAQPSFYCLPSITSMNYSDSDIICEDADGDGYYFWGIGPKPSWCPSWIPNTKDGNDNDPTKGSMDQYGNLETLNPNSTYVINGNVTYSTQQSIYTNLRITSNSKLTLSSTMNMFGRVKITIEENGQLIVNGGVITNADINMMAGGKLTIKNGGIIVMQTGKDFNVPINAILDVENGKIIKSNNY